MMTKKEILEILKKAANLEPKFIDGQIYGTGAICYCPECKDMDSYEYCHVHYPKMKKLLESLP